jgi:Ca2+-binding EF-hand superfamily protein
MRNFKTKEEKQMKKLVLFMVMIFFVMTAANVFAGGESLESIFYSLDVDKDGNVTREELCVYYTDTEVCSERFYFFDQNDDDKLSLEEFVELADKPELVFVNIDVDKDGRITKKELCALYDDVAICEKRFIHYDRNGDGYIILQEFEVVFK